ncbi:MAG: MAPEG family protein [Pseudomonadota bacterium]
MTPGAMILPIMAMALLSFVVFLWMLVSRSKAMSSRGLDAQEAQDTRALREKLPHEANRIANNYNHLFEQPVVFYAICLSIEVLGHSDAFFVASAWVFVALRVCHTLVQSLVDIVLLRFLFFGLAWIVLATMTVRESFKLV